MGTFNFSLASIKLSPNYNCLLKFLLPLGSSVDFRKELVTQRIHRLWFPLQIAWCKKQDASEITEMQKS